MKPYGREKKLKGTGRWKEDVHPKKGYINWWETMCDFLSRGRMKQLWKKEVGDELKSEYVSEEEYIGKETTIDFGRDLRMSQPWRSYRNEEIFTIMRKTKSGLYMVRDSKGNEHPISKRHINYFK
jgi:hypothetical protein